MKNFLATLTVAALILSAGFANAQDTKSTKTTDKVCKTVFVKQIENSAKQDSFVIRKVCK
jgi:hypothetical protein